MDCPTCRVSNPDDAKFCSNCGTKLIHPCPNCGAESPAGAKFCANCGHHLVASPQPAAVTPQPQQAPQPTSGLERFIPKELLKKLDSARVGGMMEGERRIVTMLFCDVKGSTAAAATLDPEEWAEIINGAFEHMIRPIYRYEGTVARLMGDGLLAFFGAPIAHEDDPQRAVFAGLEIINGLQPYRRKIAQEWGIDLNVRVGVNTGLVVVGAVGSDLRMEYTALGDAINMAARMEQTAQPGTVQIAEPTYKLVAPLFDLEVIDRLEVKGKSEPVRAYRVRGRKAAPEPLRGIRGLDSPLVGREGEFTHLISALHGLRQGQGQIVAVMGEAGLGKSRLVAEARKAVVNNDTWQLRWIEGHSQSYETTTPYAPFTRALCESASIQGELDLPGQYIQLKQHIEELFPGEGEAIAPFLAQPLGLPLPAADEERVKYLEPPLLRMMVFANITRYLEKLASIQPFVLALDDIHWIDPTSLELLLSLLPLTERLPLLILLAFRPRREDPSWQLHQTAAQTYPDRYTAIALQPLNDSQSGQLVENLLPIREIPHAISRLILDKSEGNPFFVEEIIRSLLDAELVRKNGRWTVSREITKLEVPDTLRGVITARLDRLDDMTKQVAQAAAVLGREFSYDTLAEILGQSDSGQPGWLDDSLSLLQRRELVYERSQSFQRRYTFKHVLTQEAAYESLLLSRRRQLHQLAAESIHQREPERAADIARHYLNARQPAHALPFLVQAGEQAARAYAAPEALGYYSQALTHKELGDIRTVRRAYEGLGHVQGLINQPLEALATYETMLAAAEAYGDIPMQVSALNKLAATSALHLGRFPEADQYLLRAEHFSRREQVRDGYAELSLVRCQMCAAQADFDTLINYMDEVVSIGKEIDSQEYQAMGLEHVATALVFLTHYDEAWDKAQEALRFARAAGDRAHEASLLCFTMPLIQIRNGDLDGALATLDEGHTLARRIGALIPQVDSDWIKAEILRLRGEYENALTFGHRAVETALPLEGFMPFELVQPLGTLGMTYLEISGYFSDEVAQFHLHAHRLLESPVGAMGGGTAWADLGWCALTLGDAEIAAASFEKGLNYPTLFMRVERPRYLAGMALIELARGHAAETRRLAEEACDYVAERKMAHVAPLIWLVMGRVLAGSGEHQAALGEFSRAEQAARKLAMRPLLWQAQAAAADSLYALGRTAAAEVKLEQARAVVQEIATLFHNNELRDAYLQHIGSLPYRDLAKGVFQMS